MTENPYSVTQPVTAAQLFDDDRSLLGIARRVFLAWEKLRIAYIVVLGLISLLLVGPGLIGSTRVIMMLFEGAVAANILYFAGPVVETYIRWLGFNRSWPRWFLFLGGTALATVLAVASLASLLLPNQN